MKITTLDKTAEDLFKSFFFIPRFQRPYSWEKEQVEAFWNDTVVENTTDYFIGSVVLYKQGNSNGIVDGQQRITTLVLVLCALRNAFHKAKLGAQANGLQAIVEKIDIDNKKQFVLQTESSYPYLQDKILSHSAPQTKDEPSAEEQLLRDTFAFLEDKINEALRAWPTPPKAKAGARDEAILKAIRDRVLGLKLITVELDNEDDAYVIFETLNTRGKDLQVSHLVKNHLSRLLKAKNKGLDGLKHNWDKLLETFESTQADLDVDTYLHHYWLTRAKYVTAKKLYSSMKANITAATANEELARLVEDATLYRRIGEPSYGRWKKEDRDLRYSLLALSSIFRMRQPFPLLLSLMRCYRDGTLSRKNVEAAIWQIECFHFTFTAVASKSSSGGLSFMYASLAQRLAAAKKDSERQAILKEIKNGLKRRVPSRDDFVAGFLEIRNSDEFTKQKKLARYILNRIDQHVARPGVAIDYENMTIEHVAAQNAQPGAPKVSSDHIAMLGNQLLCDIALQDKLKNKGFAEKKKLLTSAHLPTANDIVSQKSWDQKAITKRTKALAELAYDQIWTF